jgi:HSP20 family protein
MLTRWYEAPVFHRDLFKSLFDNQLFGWDPVQSAGAPRFDVYDAGQQVIVRGELPGLTEQELSISTEKDTLTIAGERNLTLPEGYRVLRRERLPLKFSRTFKLSNELDLAAIEAKLENGVLTLSIPKRPETQPRQIQIKVS